MKKIKSFFKNLFSAKPKVVCMKANNGLYYRGELVQGRWEATGEGYDDCETCKRETGATECM